MNCCGETIMNTNVVCLKRSQIDQASEILANAFNDDPMFRYLSSEAEQARTNFLKWNCKTALRYCQPHNHIYTTASNLKGVAAWIPPGNSSFNILRLLPMLLALPFKLDWSKLGRVMSLLSTMEEHHKQDMPQPHWYLAMLGVAPAYQGQRIGSSLLQPILKQAEREGLPCYLETSTQQAVRFYQKQGFEVLWMGELPGGSPSLWTMKREPQRELVNG